MNPELQHLYIMQNEHGCVKIGRSTSPEKRRRELELDVGCKVAIVNIFENCGHFEECILIDLMEAGLHLEGEWFYGRPDDLHLFLTRLELPEDTRWPYLFSEEGTHNWLKSWLPRRYNENYRRGMRRLIERLTTSPGDEQWDFLLWRELWPDHTFKYDHQLKKHRLMSGPLKGEPVPPVTTNIHAALLLWPEAIRPSTHEGNAIEICIAAINAHLKRGKSWRGT